MHNSVHALQQRKTSFRLVSWMITSQLLDDCTDDWACWRPESAILWLDFIIIIIIIIMPAKNIVRLSQKCCRCTVRTALSHICTHSNSYNSAVMSHRRVKMSFCVFERCVFICRLNAVYDSDVLTDASRAFQAHAAATGNARITRCRE